MNGQTLPDKDAFAEMKISELLGLLCYDLIVHFDLKLQPESLKKLEEIKAGRKYKSSDKNMKLLSMIHHLLNNLGSRGEIIL
jgi:hypothetical protein